MNRNQLQESLQRAFEQESHHQHCAQLEDESGNDHAANALKAQLSTALNGHAGTADLNDLILDRQIDLKRIDMPSLNQFKADFCQVVALALVTGKQA